MNRIMLDLETLSSQPNAVIASIGAVWFDEENLGAPFYQVVNVESQPGRHISARTVVWWMAQERKAQEVFTDRPMADLDVTLTGFARWIGEASKHVEMWGNGADFDCVILGSAYEDCGIPKPWSYSKNRCYRTLKNIVKLRPGFGIPERQGTHHNALDDAIYQAKCAQVYLKELQYGKQGNS